MSAQALVRLEKQGRTALITLADDAHRNALGPRLRAALEEAATAAGRDPDVRSIILSGGDTIFATDEPGERTGAAIAPREARLPRAIRRDRTAFDAIRASDKPVIAILRGLVEGEGLDLALGCDIRFATPDLRIEPRIVSTAAVPRQSALLGHAIGLGAARAWILGAVTVDAAEADRTGFIERIVPAERIQAGALALAERIANGPPVALNFTRRIMYRGLSATGDDQYHYTVLARTLLFHLTDETREGFDSFTEKRPPKF